MTKIFAIPFYILVVFLFCGCAFGGTDSASNEGNFFFEDKVVTIKEGEMRKVKLDTELSYSKFDFSWNSDVISYDIDSGNITAINAGQTELKAVLKSASQKKVSCLIVVEKTEIKDNQNEKDNESEIGKENNDTTDEHNNESKNNDSGSDESKDNQSQNNNSDNENNISESDDSHSEDENIDKIFATKVEVDDSFKFVKGSEFELNAKVFPANCDYGLIFESSDTQIFTVDENGKVVAKACGEAVLVTKAVRGVSGDTFDYIEISSQVLVEDEMVATMNLCDVNGKNLGAEARLFYGENACNYFAKITANKSLKTSRFSAPVFEGLNVCLENVKFTSSTEAIIPLEVNSFGKFNFCIEITESFSDGLKTSSTNYVYISAYEHITKIEPRVIVSYKDGDEEVIENLPTTDGFYQLFELGGDYEDKVDGHNDKKFYKAVIIFDKLNLCCYNKFTVCADNDNISLNEIEENVYLVTAKKSGYANVTIVANDESKKSVALRFVVSSVETESCTFYPEKQIYFDLNNRKKLNLGVTNIVPAYSSDKCKLEIIYGKNEPVIISDENTIYPVEVGCCVAVVTFGKTKVSYKIFVGSNALKISCDTQAVNYVDENGYFNLKYSVVDENDKKVKNQKIKLEFEGESADYELAGGVVLINLGGLNEVKFSLVLERDGQVIFKTFAITVKRK